MGRAAPTLHLAPTKLGLITLLVLNWAVQVGAVPITTFNSAFQFRWNIGPNSVGLPPGDRQCVGILNVSPTAGTTVNATQGAVSRPLPFTPFTSLPTQFRALEPFDPSLTGPWSITATNGPDVAGPVLAPAIANPQLLPFVQNLQVVGTGPTPTVTWSLPDLTGFDVELLRFRVYNDVTNDVLFNLALPSLATTAFTIPDGLLVPGVPYAFSVSVEDGEPSTSTENVSTAFTQSAYFTVPPAAANDLLVSSELTDSVKRYDAKTGRYLGDFVSAGGQVEPRGLTFGPDGNLYVAGGGDGDPNVKRFDGRTGAPIDIVTSGYPSQINDITFGPDGYLYGSVQEGDSVFRVDPTTRTKVGEIGVDGAHRPRFRSRRKSVCRQLAHRRGLALRRDDGSFHRRLRDPAARWLDLRRDLWTGRRSLRRGLLLRSCRVSVRRCRAFRWHDRRLEGLVHSVGRSPPGGAVHAVVRTRWKPLRHEPPDR